MLIFYFMAYYLYMKRGPNGYPMGMGIFSTHGYLRGRVMNIFMGIVMDLILLDLCKTRTIVIL